MLVALYEPSDYFNTARVQKKNITVCLPEIKLFSTVYISITIMMIKHKNKIMALLLPIVPQLFNEKPVTQVPSVDDRFASNKYMRRIWEFNWNFQFENTPN